MSTVRRMQRPWALVALLLAAVVAGGCRQAEDARAEDTAAPGVTLGSENIAIVELDTIESGPVVSGTLSFEREATLRAQVGGPVVDTYVEQGQRVARGALLARLDDAAIQEAFLSARSALTTAQSGADVAARELSRAERLAEAGAIADRDLEQARRVNIAAQSQLADARARLSLARKQLDDTRIRAPFTGVIAARQANAGDIVSPGAALFTVVDPASMRLEATVPAEQLSAVRVGAPVTFAVSGYPGRSFGGRVSGVNPAADPATRQVRILVSIPNAGQALVGGLFAEGRVASESRLSPVIPAAAVDQRGLTPSAMRVRAGKVERVELRLGIRDAAAERQEVLAGLQAGDTVLLGGAQGLTPGTSVVFAAPTERANAQP